MTITPHPSYEFGFVDGRFVKAVADRGNKEDVDRNPDFIPATEVIVKFTPAVSARKIVDAPSMYVTKTPTEAIVAEDGRLRLRGQPSEPPGVGLIAGVYNVTFTGVPLPPIQIEVLPTHTEQNPLDLITALPYEPGPNDIVQLVALPTGGEPGQVLGRAPHGLAWVDQTGGESQGPSHQSIQVSGNVTLPIEHPVLTIRADDPATLSLPEAPDGTVVTIHVAHGWENLTWSTGITITGDSVTTETWIVLVRKEGGWSALVSGSGGGGMSGHGRPDGISWPYGEYSPISSAPILAPLGTVYTDLDRTDGALQWTVTGLGWISWYDPDTGTYPGMPDGPLWEVTIGGTEWHRSPWSDSDPLTPPAGYDEINISARRRGDWVDVEISLMPSGIGQGVPVTVPPVQSYFFNPPQNFAPSAFGYFPIEVEGDPDFVAAVGEPPQAWLNSIRFLNIPSFEIGAFTAGEYPYMGLNIKAAYRIKGHLAWPSQMERPDTPPDPGNGGGGAV